MRHICVCGAGTVRRVDEGQNGGNGSAGHRMERHNGEME